MYTTIGPEFVCDKEGKNLIMETTLYETYLKPDFRPCIDFSIPKGQMGIRNVHVDEDLHLNQKQGLAAIYKLKVWYRGVPVNSKDVGAPN
jgi:hypothetical protein